MKNLILLLVLMPLIGYTKSNRVTSSSNSVSNSVSESTVNGQLSTEYKPRAIYGSNFLGVEVLGRGVLYSLNYDRAITSRFSVGAGLSYYQFNIVGINVDIALLPIYGNYYFGGQRHRALVTGGATVTYAKAEIKDAYYWDHYSPGSGSELSYSYARAEGTSLNPNVGIGYEFRARAGFTARVTSYYQYANNQMYPWLGAMLGTHF